MTGTPPTDGGWVALVVPPLLLVGSGMLVGWVLRGLLQTCATLVVAP